MKGLPGLSIKNNNVTPKRQNIQTTCKLPCVFLAFHGIHTHTYTQHTITYAHTHNIHTTNNNIAKTWGSRSKRQQQTTGSCCNSGKRKDVKKKSALLYTMTRMQSSASGRFDLLYKHFNYIKNMGRQWPSMPRHYISSMIRILIK